MTKPTKNPWRIVRNSKTEDGHEIEMRHAVFGKGRSKVESWKIFRDGAEVGYAVNAADADVNYARVLSGLVRDVRTGRYVPAES